MLIGKGCAIIEGLLKESHIERDYVRMRLAVGTSSIDVLLDYALADRADAGAFITKAKLRVIGKLAEHEGKTCLVAEYLEVKKRGGVVCQ